MGFDLSSWFLRRRIDAEVRTSGRPVEHRRIANPYHAVSIKAGMRCQQTAQKYGRQRFLSGEAPQLPQPTCDARACECRYVHHEDRRDGFDRRQRDVWAASSQLAKSGGRRASHGRRVTDH